MNELMNKSVVEVKNIKNVIEITIPVGTYILFANFLTEVNYRIWIPLTIFVVIYGIYYLITVQLYQGIVLPKKE